MFIVIRLQHISSYS